MNFNNSKSESGTSTVEFAMILPVFFLFFFGIMEFGWLMTQEIMLTHAVSEGARAVLLEPDAGRRIQAAKDRVKSVFEPAETLSGTHLSEGNIKVTISDITRQITVEVAALDYAPLVGFIPDTLLPDKLHAKAAFTYP